jgi:hypothetical protein
MTRVGGEVDALCNRCELTLAHTVIAMLGGQPVKVECNTCHSVHRYRDAAAAPRRSSAARAPRERRSVQSFDELLRARVGAGARRYSPRDSYSAGQVIEHPTFGPGWVSAVRDGGKIEVTFRSTVKTLVHGKGGR